MDTNHLNIVIGGKQEMLYLSLFEAHSSPPKPYGYRWGVLLHNYEA